MKELRKKRVAMLATDGFEESELTEPKSALEKAGAEVDIISDKKDNIRSWKDGNWSNTYPVNRSLESASSNDYDALVLPGGLMNPDRLRKNKQAVGFVKDFFKEHKPVGAICHGPWMLAEADVLGGRQITSYESIRTDMENAGARWQNREVVVDQGLVTSRTPEDLPAFNSKLVEEVYEGKHRMQTA